MGSRVDPAVADRSRGPEERPMQLAVQQAISAMRDRYFDPITLGQIAAEVFVSPFHLSRVFAELTGVTPGRYLTAVRLFEAKRLLLTTDLTVADVVSSVGYNSVGTFTSRFTKAVGMTPTQYRSPEVRELLLAVSPDFHRVPPAEALPGASGLPVQGAASVSATVDLPAAAAPANVLVGLFAERIPQCGPVAYAAQAGVGSTRLTISDVPPGRWTVLAVAEGAHGGGAESIYLGTVRQPVAVSPGGATRVSLRLRELQPTDPPIAITLASETFPRGMSRDLARPELRVAA
ncbi:helix-turn-helix transcriptional regulator [Amycolatopsis sp. CM201R]|nr:helix-turn-helix transcriptional regulator [Amycolatopsis sp. 505]MDS0141933.1 helix-turn-helix transcriptional regulator [Amycolatopsis sp. CM201R]